MRPGVISRPISQVIGIAGAAGSGKSTIVRHLSAAIPGSAVVHFDAHPVEMPSDLRAWLDAGADFDLWKAPGLSDAVAEAKSMSDLVIFEAPLGRRHQETGSTIDFLVFIEIPLEIALARFVRRELEGGGERVLEYLEAYEPFARDVYREQLRQVKPDADLVLDGRSPVDANVEVILDRISRT